MGSSDRCVTCPPEVEGPCVFSARKVYVDRAKAGHFSFPVANICDNSGGHTHTLIHKHTHAHTRPVLCCAALFGAALVLRPRSSCCGFRVCLRDVVCVLPSVWLYVRVILRRAVCAHVPPHRAQCGGGYACGDGGTVRPLCVEV